MTKTKNPKYDRLSEALRKNLLKRKEQQRNREKNQEKNDSIEVAEEIENSSDMPFCGVQGEKH